MIDKLKVLEFTPNTPDIPAKCIVRLTTCCWSDSNGLHMKKSLRYLKRKCTGYNILYEDDQNIGTDGVIDHIDNLWDCKDGVYEVVTCNEWVAWETPGTIEDYDYKLIPYENKAL